MILTSLTKPNLVLLAEELGIPVQKSMRKPAIIEAISKCGANDDEVEECWRAVSERLKEREVELKLKEMQLHNLERNDSFDMRGYMQPFKAGSDITLYLVNFERTCTRAALAKETWSQRLLTLLPNEAADVIARMPDEDAHDYEKVKLHLRRRYSLSTEALRMKFRNTRRGQGESFSEFAYRSMSLLEEWLKSANAYEDKQRLIELFALEQFYASIPDQMRLWIQDKPNVETLQTAASLADEYRSRRMESSEEQRKKPSGAFKKFQKGTKETNQGKPGDSVPAQGHAANASEPKSSKFEEKQPLVCYKCQQPGHIAVGCRQPAVSVNLLTEESDLLLPYTYDMKVNGISCNVLRDTGATFDIVHPSFVKPENLTGSCVWVRQALEPDMKCLPVARVEMKGAFGTFETDAAVSDKLPQKIPYIFSNRSMRDFQNAGLELNANPVMVVTRSQTRAQATSATRNTEITDQSEPTQATAPSETVPVDANCVAPAIDSSTPVGNALPGEAINPVSENFQLLAKLDKSALKMEQANDESLKTCWEKSKRKQKGAVSFIVKEGILYRTFKNKKGRTFEQLVVPKKYRVALLGLVHSDSWAGHLGINKTKSRLLNDYYWPMCFKESENWVRSCNVCQRTGRPNEKLKAPLVQVPLIGEPFRRLVVDIVGPLPVTAAGNKYLLTLICPATKFPEAVVLPELSSTAVVNALLGVFARIGFPSEIQCDQGSVFTSALTTTFLKKCGISVHHSSVYHPQSNSVEKLHSVMKRILRALCFEKGADWDEAVPAMLFALRSVTHEATGFTPAELVYGRALRSPLTLLKEKWEDKFVDKSVVEYVLTLLKRLRESQELAQINMAEAQQRSKVYYDRSARTRTFKEGDKVLILRSSKANKLEVAWDGPVTIKQKLSDTNYLVTTPGKRNDVTIYHCNLMKPFIERSETLSIVLNEPEEINVPLPQVPSPCSSPSTEEIVQSVTKQASLTDKQRKELELLVRNFRDLFSPTPGRTNLVEHDIELTSNQPFRTRMHRFSPRHEKILNDCVQNMLTLGLIVPGESEYVSPMFIVESPGKEPRPCIDYRKLNAITKTKMFPIPNVEGLIEKVSAARYVSTLDLVRGFWQVPLTENASKLATFMTPTGTYRPLVLTFGLKNAPFAFSRLMHEVLKGAESFAVPYLDDIAVFSSTWQQHLEHLQQVFLRIHEAGLTLKLAKCRLASSEVHYLGHVVGQGKRRPSEIKVEAITSFPLPKTKTNLRSFLGLADYYRSYIPNFANIASPLTDALRKTEPTIVSWNKARKDAFAEIKKILVSKPVLAAPDYSLPFLVQCDASDRGMGVVLSQVNEKGEEHPVVYASRKLTSREQAYSTTEKECACLVWALEKLSCYLKGSSFVFETDHSPLVWLNQMSNKNSRLMRWSLALQQFDFSVRHKKGKHHANADCLSRTY